MRQTKMVLENETGKSLAELVKSIKNLHSSIQPLSHQFQNVLQQSSGKNLRLNERSSTHWKFVAYSDALLRIKLLLEQNFHHIESMGLLAVTRYAFELTVWLKLLKSDGRFGSVYYYQLIDNQRCYYRDLKKQLSSEIAFLRSMAAEERKCMKQQLDKNADLNSVESAFSNNINGVISEIDNLAARRFSIYAEQARINGYDYQAYLVETERLPEIENSIAEIEEFYNNFKRDVAPEIQDLAFRKWNWKNHAKAVDMEHEYEFIYSYTSRLLHATPVSVTTNQKNLELDEMRLFLKYIRIRLTDIIAMAKNLVSDDYKPT